MSEENTKITSEEPVEEPVEEKRDEKSTQKKKDPRRVKIGKKVGIMEQKK